MALWETGIYRLPSRRETRFVKSRRSLSIFVMLSWRALIVRMSSSYSLLSTQRLLLELTRRELCLPKLLRVEQASSEEADSGPRTPHQRSTSTASSSFRTSSVAVAGSMRRHPQDDSMHAGDGSGAHQYALRHGVAGGNDREVRRLTDRFAKLKGTCPYDVRTNSWALVIRKSNLHSTSRPSSASKAELCANSTSRISGAT